MVGISVEKPAQKDVCWLVHTRARKVSEQSEGTGEEQKRGKRGAREDQERSKREEQQKSKRRVTDEPVREW
jgi:hypothetical protein